MTFAFVIPVLLYNMSAGADCSLRSLVLHVSSSVLVQALLGECIPGAVAAGVAGLVQRPPAAETELEARMQHVSMTTRAEEVAQGGMTPDTLPCTAWVVR